MRSITAVVPCYNLGYVLPRAVASLKAQSYSDLEIIVVDDCSTDGSLAVAESLDVKVIRHRENRGLSAALNTGFAEATGELFVVLSADDQLDPSALSKMASLDTDVAVSHMLVGDEVVKCRPLDLNTLMSSNCHGYAALFKRWVWEKTGGFKEAMNPSWEDYEFWLHAAKLGAKGALVPEPLFVYNPNPMGRSWEAQGQERLLRGKLEGFHQDLFGSGRGVVTVIVPLYEQERWLPDAIDSVREQVYPHVEMLVVDDASPGSIGLMPESFGRSPLDVPQCQDALGRVPVIRHEENRGLSAARNTGFLNTSSQYVVPLDADDEIHPAFIEKCMVVMGDRDYVYTDIYFVGDATHEFSVKPFRCEELYRRHIHAVTVLMQKRMWQDVVDRRGFGFDETMRAGYEDWDFTLAAVEAGWWGKYLQELLFGYRFHADGSMRTDAGELSLELRELMRVRHPRKAFMANCPGGCVGGGRYTRRSRRVIDKPGLGEVGLSEPVLVFYNGDESFPEKRGVRLYQSKRCFFACGEDVHLFDESVFTVYLLSEVSPDVLRTAMEEMDVAEEGVSGV